ncbi:unnamed protein product [Chrysoparadoxa australica]
MVDIDEMGTSKPAKGNSMAAAKMSPVKSALKRKTFTLLTQLTAVELVRDKQREDSSLSNRAA